MPTHRAWTIHAAIIAVITCHNIMESMPASKSPTTSSHHLKVEHAPTQPTLTRAFPYNSDYRNGYLRPEKTRDLGKGWQTESWTLFWPQSCLMAASDPLDPCPSRP